MINKSFYKLTYLLLVVLFIIANVIVAPKIYATNTADSLKQTLANKKGLERANTLIKILEYYHNIDPDSALHFSKKLDKLSNELDFDDGKYAAFVGILNVDFIQGNYTECIDKAIPYLNEPYDDPGYHIANMYLSVGNCYGSLGLYKAGVELYLKAKSIFLKINEPGRIQTINNNLGAYYIRMGDFNSAKFIFENLEPLSVEDPTRITRTVNLGFISLGLKEYEEAGNYFKTALEFGSSSIEIRGKAISAFKLGDLYNELEKHEKAISNYELSIKYFTEIQNKAQTINPLIGLASCNLKMGNLKKAEAYALEAEELGNTTNTLHELTRATTILSDVYAKNNDFKKAYDYSVKSKNLTDSLNVSRKNQEIQVLETEFEFRLREEQIKRAQIAALNRQKLYLQIVLCVLIISLIVALVIYRSRKKLEKLNRELGETNEIKNRLFSIIAHDLRNPLSSLYGMVTLLEMNSASKEKIQNLIPQLVDQFKHTSNLLNNLLNWSKSQMEGYKVIPEFFDIDELFKENITLLKSRIDEKKIDVNIDSSIPGKVFADKNMINLVILNLLSNAVKFSDENDSVTITKSLKDSELIVQVRDTGVGIPDNKLDTIFTKSFYSTAGTRDEKGTGLGLMLCREFIEKNGGEIWLDNTLEKGTAFYFTVSLFPENDA